MSEEGHDWTQSTPRDNDYGGHPNTCSDECVHCRLRKTDTAELVNEEHGIWKLRVNHDPAECPKCDKDYAVST